MDIIQRLLLELEHAMTFLGQLLTLFQKEPQQLQLPLGINGSDEDRISALRARYNSIGNNLAQLERIAQTRTRNDLPQGGSHEKSVSAPTEDINRR